MMPSDNLQSIQNLEQIAQENAQIKILFQQERRRFRLQMGFALLAVIGAILLSPASRRAVAQQTGGLPALEKRVATLEATTSAQQNTITNLQNALNNEINRAMAAEATLTTNLNNEVIRAQGAETTLTNHLNAEVTRAEAGETILTTHVTALQTLTAPLSLSGTDFTITGVNVHIVDGSGSTVSSSGLGNLTIGYNASRIGAFIIGVDVRTGSHNLIIGDYNNYASYGGFVVGIENSILAPYASVSGGLFNTVSNRFSTVSGGDNNTASGTYSTVSGGQFNTASGDWSTVSGGGGNTTSAYSFAATVSGGAGNTASEDWSTVSGGTNNTAGGPNSTVSGGTHITQNNLGGWSGGAYHTP